MMIDILCIDIIIAFIIDILIGDPEYTLHPIRIIGYMITKFEKFFRKISANQFLNGLTFALFIIILATFFIVMLMVFSTVIDNLIKIKILIHLINIFFIYSAISLNDLRKKTIEIYKLLNNKDIENARIKLSFIVGRDTKNMDKKEIIRATVETVSENISDGIIAPLFYTIIGGAPLAIFYKSINTLDSMVGYKNDKYKDFGKASAIIDDIFNYIPARITGFLISLAGFILLKNGFNSLKIMIRDGRKNPSPNSGIPEAAVAGALKVQLGGINYYYNKKTVKPLIGDNINELEIKHIKESIGLCYITSIVFLVIGITARYILINLNIFNKLMSLLQTYI